MADKYLISCYRKAVKKTKILTAEEEQKLCERVSQGDKTAIDLLIKGSLRTVWNIAIKYATVEVDVFDLIQEGNIGLIHAVERFNPAEGVRFNTYATFWVRQKIHRYFHEKARTIRIPVYKEDITHRIKTFTEKFREGNAREPSINEIADGIGKSASFVSNILLDNLPCASLDFMDSDHEFDLSSCIGDMRHNPESRYCADCDKSMLEQAMDILSERDKEIIKMRYGFLDREYTLMEVAERMCLSIERCRQIQVQSLSKMKEFYRKKKIKRI
jgi:RNA polymerase sigma factor (sigma-70 family)